MEENLENEAGAVEAGATVLIGSNYNFSEGFFGRIDEMRISAVERSDALLDAQVLAAYGGFIVFEERENLADIQSE